MHSTPNVIGSSEWEALSLRPWILRAIYGRLTHVHMRSYLVRPPTYCAQIHIFLSAHGPYCDRSCRNSCSIPLYSVRHGYLLTYQLITSDRYQSKTRPICLIVPYLGPTTPHHTTHPFINHHIQHVKKKNRWNCNTMPRFGIPKSFPQATVHIQCRDQTAPEVHVALFSRLNFRRASKAG